MNIHPVGVTLQESRYNSGRNTEDITFSATKCDTKCFINPENPTGLFSIIKKIIKAKKMQPAQEDIGDFIEKIRIRYKNYPMVRVELIEEENEIVTVVLPKVPPDYRIPYGDVLISRHPKKSFNKLLFEQEIKVHANYLKHIYFTKFITEISHVQPVADRNKSIGIDFGTQNLLDDIFFVVKRKAKEKKHLSQKIHGPHNPTNA